MHMHIAIEQEKLAPVAPVSTDRLLIEINNGPDRPPVSNSYALLRKVSDPSEKPLEDVLFDLALAQVIEKLVVATRVDLELFIGARYCLVQPHGV
jgi:hypothetical protein